MAAYLRSYSTCEWGTPCKEEDIAACLWDSLEEEDMADCLRSCPTVLGVKRRIWLPV